MIKCSLSHSALALSTEKRFDPAITVAQLKEKLYLVAGTAPDNMILQLRDKDGRVLNTVQGDERRLGDFVGAADHCYLHIVDTNPQVTQQTFGDVSQVEKFQISEEAYEKRQDNFRRFREKFLKKSEAELKAEAEEEAKMVAMETEKARDMRVGQRCEVQSEVEGPRRGVVLYLGVVEGKPGPFAGVKLDEPLGQNDGSVKGHRYFECPPKYGLFVRPSKVKVGDFPEIDPLADSDVDEEI